MKYELTGFSLLGNGPPAGHNSKKWFSDATLRGKKSGRGESSRPISKPVLSKTPK